MSLVPLRVDFAARDLPRRPLISELIQGGQRAHHCGLSPVQRRSFVHQPRRVSAIVEVPGLVLHVSYCPPSDLNSLGNTTRVALSEVHEGVDCLRAALDIDWQSFVVVIAGRTVAEKECIS